MSVFTIITVKMSNRTATTMQQQFQTSLQLQQNNTPLEVKNNTQVAPSPFGGANTSPTMATGKTMIGGETAGNSSVAKSRALSSNPVKNKMLKMKRKVKRISKLLAASSYLLVVRLMVLGLFGTPLFTSGAMAFGLMMMATYLLVLTISILGIMTLHDITQSE